MWVHYSSTRNDLAGWIKKALTSQGQQSLDTGISCIRSHIGIPGNEIADKEAGIRSFTGQLLSQTHTATEGGIRQAHKAARATYRSRPTLGLGQLTQWPRRALSAYTWTRTNRGPMRQWLHHIKLAADPSCAACHHPQQDRIHIVFHCPALQTQRLRTIGTREGDSWEHLDRPLLIKSRTEANQQQDGREAFFLEIFNFLTQHS